MSIIEWVPTLLRWEDHIYGSYGYIESDPVNPCVEIQCDHSGEHRIHIGVHSQSSDGETPFFRWILTHEGIFRHQEDAKRHAPAIVAQWLWQNATKAA
ncbi:hypothetical protein [Agrobacterium sp. LAD9]|uniref:hypothetical protein n=1 Tax=Agrobacterium sp. LAD9 TaxID=2055153 RepID=UPI000D1F0B1D|nr:hypothetical protein [Agrobacterium sp. LAD9]